MKWFVYNPAASETTKQNASSSPTTLVVYVFVYFVNHNVVFLTGLLTFSNYNTFPSAQLGL